MRKLLLTLGTIATIVAPVATVVSCGSSTPDSTPPKQTPPVNQPPATQPPKAQPPVSQPVETGTGTHTGTNPGTSGDQNTNQNGAYLSTGAKISTIDRDSASIEKDVVLDKDGHILSWPAFEAARGTRANSRYPHVTDPHPIPVPAEPFTRTTSPGAMDVTGWTSDYKSGEPKTTSELAQIVANYNFPPSTVTPISYDQFTKISEIFTGHLVVSGFYSTKELIHFDSPSDKDIAKIVEKILVLGNKEISGDTDKRSDAESKIPADPDDYFRKFGITLIQEGVTSEVHVGSMMGEQIKMLSLKNVIFKLKDEMNFIPVDIDILIK